MQYIIEYEVAAIILSLVVLFSFFRKKIVTTTLTNSFMVVLIVVLSASIIDIAGVYVMNYCDNAPLWLKYFLNTAYYAVFSIFPIAFYNCIRGSIVEHYTRTKFKKIRYFTPIVIAELLILTTPFTHFVFYFDDLLGYHWGPGFVLIYVSAAIYFGSAIYKSILYRKLADASQRIAVYFYTISCVITVIIQISVPRLLVIGFIATVSVMMLFLSLVNPTNYLDKEMNILNQEAFRAVTNQFMQKEKPFRIIGIHVIGVSFLNETIGLEHKAQILKQLSILLKTAAGKYQVFRVSGSRLMIVIPDDEELQKKTIERVHNVFSDSILMGDFKISLTEHVAVMRYPDDAQSIDDIEELMRATLHSIRDAEPGTVVHADKEALRKKERELKILQVMKQAVRRGDFYVVYQPIYSFEQSRFTTAEALVRLENEELGEVSPEEFIPVAEHNGMILQIGEFVFESVCRFVLHQKIWEKGIEYIHVNLSVIQCMQKDLADQLFKIMDLYNLDYRYINLEVTESAAIASSDVLMSNMNRLIERNMNFSLDDFGTGFSNTVTLIRYPFHTIKLDKSMVWEAMHNPKAETVLRNTIEMVKLLKMEIVAEGAETPEQIEKLKEMGADFVQGYYYSKPITRDDFIRLITEDSRRW